MKILLVTTNQFGYLVDYHRYYTYLKKKGHDVKYVCLDSRRERIEGNNPDIIYVPRVKNKVSKHYRFMKSIVETEKKYNFDRIMIHVFPLVSLLSLFIDKNKIFLDIRTLSIHRKQYKRSFFDFLIRVASRVYTNTSSITDVAAKQLGLRHYKLLPLGGAYFGNQQNGMPENDVYNHIFENGYFIIIYVGTLYKRRIIECVQGFHAYMNKHPGTKARFVIIGTSIKNELNEINAYIAHHSLQKMVFTLGYIPQARLSYFFNHSDCGIAYTPLTMPYPLQPTTKTYEYLVNGIPVIATATLDNIQMVENSKVPCGVIIKDNSEDIESAVGKILENSHLYNKADIAHEFNRFEWDNLFDVYLDDALNLPKTKYIA
ncbi:MAG TPA: glycosyltransferase [Flavitalea sp.]|nr:glycosyltransferase [Flavitalea sp.]